MSCNTSAIALAVRFAYSIAMLQELFRIPGVDIPIYGYGLMMVIGFLAAAQLGKVLARHCGLDGELFVNAALIALIAGVFGARLSHVLENFSYYTTVTPTRSAWDNFIDAINIRSGGLTFYGGFLFATPVLIWYGWRKKIPIRVGMDIVAPCLMVGLAFGRIGCFLNGCCYGAQCDLPWAVQFPPHSNASVDQARDEQIASPAQPSLPVHPAQLYSSFNAFLLAATLYAFFTLPHAPGQVFALMLVLKGITRFLLEMLRTEPAVLGPLSFSMVVSIGLVAGGVLLWIVFGKMAPRESPTSASSAPATAAAPT